MRGSAAPQADNETLLDKWLTEVRTDDLPYLHAFSRGPDNDRNAVIAAVTLPFHNGVTEGVNTKTNLIKRQIYDRAGFQLFRRRIFHD